MMTIFRPSRSRVLDLWSEATMAVPTSDYTSEITDQEGTPLTDPEDCGFVFQGYAVPVLDPESNHEQEDEGCFDEWTAWIGWHVNTASTCTIPLPTGGYRMYLPEPRLQKEAERIPDPKLSPFSHPHRDRVRRYPDDKSWAEYTLRFSSDYIAFVDSADGSNFPVYAPKMTLTDGVCDFWDVDDPDWANAGWTPTCVPSRSVPGNEAGLWSISGTTGERDYQYYSVYRDPSVVYVPSKGKYLMFAVECRSTIPYVGTSGPCLPGGDYVIPFTRYVVFLSDSPDFPAGDTIPDPVDASALAVLVQPDEGAGGPIGRVPPTEWYGVPHALMSPDGAQVLVYLTWSGSGGATSAPARIEARYGSTSLPWQPHGDPTAGISVFAIDAGALVDALVAGDTAEVLALASAGYQGEALLTDGTRDAYGVPQILWGFDHQFLVCNGYLWAYYPTPADCVYEGESACNSEASPTQLHRLQHVPLDELPWELRDLFEGTGQGDYTVFLAPTSCWTVFDLASVLPLSPDGAATRDPDLAVLADGRIRVAMSYQAPTGKATFVDQGLIQAIAVDHSLCVPEDFFTEAPEEEEPAIDCEALCSSTAPGAQALCALLCGDRPDGLGLDYCEIVCARADLRSQLACGLVCGGGLWEGPPIDRPGSGPSFDPGDDSTLWQHRYVTARGAKVYIWP